MRAGSREPGSCRGCVALPSLAVPFPSPWSPGAPKPLAALPRSDAGPAPPRFPPQPWEGSNPCGRAGFGPAQRLGRPWGKAEPGQGHGGGPGEQTRPTQLRGVTGTRRAMSGGGRDGPKHPWHCSRSRCCWGWQGEARGSGWVRAELAARGWGPSELGVLERPATGLEERAEGWGGGSPRGGGQWRQLCLHPRPRRRGGDGHPTPTAGPGPAAPRKWGGG